MVYKKYIYKNGRKLGPYYYESKRIGSRIKTVYLGSKPKKKVALHKLKYPSMNSISLISFLLFVSLLGLLFLRTYTGFVTLQPYTDIINLNVNSSQSYTWQVQNSGPLNYLKVSGKIIGEGTIKIYIQNNDIPYLIYDSSSTNLLTGAAIDADIYTFIDTSKKNKTKENLENESQAIENITQTQNQTETSQNISASEIVNKSEISQSILNLTENIPINEFNSICIETCSLINFTSDSYILLFELKNTSLFLNSIEYSVIQEITENITLENLTNILLKGNQTIPKQQNITSLNLSEFQIKDSKKQKLNYKVIKHEKDSLEIEIPGKNIKSIKLNGIKNLTELYIDDIPKEKIKEKKFEKVYAINPSSLEFDNATITITATGNYLYKCKDWNFTEQKCYGNWIKLFDITPGLEYTLLVTKEDPAFGEIEITKALHLDENYSLISDVYELVKERDNIWSEPIYSNEIIRITFYQNLTSLNDITVYVKNTLGLDAFIEVYPENSYEKIVEFPIINNEGYYQVLLTNMTEEPQTFDLKIKSSNSNSYLEFDHIIDPINSVTLNDPTTDLTKAPGEWFWMNCTVAKQGQPDTPDALQFHHNNSADTTMRRIPVNTSSTTLNTSSTNPIDPFSYDIMYPINVSTPNTGTYQIQCQANNSAGTTVKSAIRTITVELDTTPPNILIVNPANNSVLIGTVYVNYTYGTDANTIWYEFDSNNTNITIAKGTNITFIDLSLTIHNISLFANDSSNNINASFINFSVEADTISPDIKITNPANNSVLIGTVYVNYTYGTDSNTIWYEFDSNNTNITITTGNNITFTSLSATIHNISLFANDSSDNINSSFINFSIETDTMLPNFTNIAKNQTKIYQGTWINFSSKWADNIGLSGYIFTWNNSGNWINSSFTAFTNSVSWNISNITAGFGTYICWRFFANDSSNNWNMTMANQCLTVNNTYINWSQATLNLGTTAQNEGNLTGNAFINSTGINSNTLVGNVSGNSSVITHNYTTATLYNTEIKNILFNCDANSSASGFYTANYYVNSSLDTAIDEINITCLINAPANRTHCGGSYNESDMTDWTITTDVKCVNEYIQVDGNITVGIGGNLTLINSTINYTAPVNNNSYFLFVAPSSNGLWVYDSDNNKDTQNDMSIITSSNNQYINVTIKEDVEIVNSKLSRLGGTLLIRESGVARLNITGNIIERTNINIASTIGVIANISFNNMTSKILIDEPSSVFKNNNVKCLLLEDSCISTTENSLTFKNNTIDCNNLSDAFYLSTSSLNSFSDNTISNCKKAYRLRVSSNNVIINDTISSSDFHIELMNISSFFSENNTFINTSGIIENQTSIGGNPSTNENSFIIRYFLEAKAVDADGVAINNLNITIYDRYNTIVKTEQTDANGMIKMFVVTDYKKNNTAGQQNFTTSFNNYNITASHSDYNFNSTTSNVTSSRRITISLSLLPNVNPPDYSNITANVTSIYTGMQINFSAKWTDAGGLGGYIFSFNESNWINSSFISFSGTSNVSQNISNITVNNGTEISWKFFANDSDNNWNMTMPNQYVLILPNDIAFNQSSLNLGEAHQNSANLTKSAVITSNGINANTLINYVSGNSTVITGNYTTSTLYNSETKNIFFTCNINSTPNFYTANYYVNSSRDISKNEINISCTIKEQFASYCSGNFNNSNNNFDISTNVLCANEKMNIDGNITVLSGGNLTFKNITIVFQGTANGENFINKTENGRLWIYDNDNNQSTTNDASNFSGISKYRFMIFGNDLNDNFTLQNSIITDVGYIGGTTARGIYLENIENITIKGNNISRGSSDSFYILSSANNSIFNNTMDLNVNLVLSPSSTISNNIITGSGITLDTGSGSSNITGNTIISGGDGIFIQNSNSHSIQDNNITTSLDRGIYLSTSSNNNISLGAIRNSQIGVFAEISNSNNITNITFTNNTYDFNLTGSSSLTSINNSFNKTLKFSDNSNFTIMWFVEVYVVSNETGINITAHNTTGIKHYNTTTGSDGLTNLFLLTELIRNNSANLTSNNPFNFTASNTTFFNSTSINVDRSMRVKIGFTVPPAGANQAPTVNNLTLTPSFPNTTINLNCSFIITDTNVGDTLTVNLTWYKNSTINKTYSSISVTNGTLNMHYLHNANTTKNDNWTCGVRPYDNTDWGSEVNSSIVTIQNSGPTATTLSSPADGNKTTNRTPTFTWNAATDPDNDPITYTINISCWGGCTTDNRLVNTTSTSYIPPELRYFSDDNYYYNWTVKAIDSDANSSSYAAERNITITVLVSVTLPNSTILFGTRNIGDSVNTSNNTPSPIVMQNDGNSYININLSAQSMLFTTEPNPSTNFQYKIDNTTAEAGSFNWSGSVTTWTNIPLQNNTAVNLLNYSDANDTAEMDILITVPLNEPAGNLTSNLIVTGYYTANY